MNEFLTYIKNNPDEIKSEDAQNQIIKNLMVKNLRQLDKLEDLDEYDSESLFNGKLYRGNIYIFTYDAKEPTKYTYGNDSVYFTDTMPVFLMLGETTSSIYGINFNFCNKALKTLILNLIRNLDLDFFENGIDQKLAANKNLVISEKLYKFLSDQRAVSIIKEFLNKMYAGIDYDVIFRNYSISQIKNIRLIEPWQWKYIPYLNYEGSLKKETLSAIQKISGINRIKI